MRMDRDANEKISAYEILNFMRDNKEYTVSESDCINLVKYYDGDSDSRLTYHEYEFLSKYVGSSKCCCRVKITYSGSTLSTGIQLESLDMKLYLTQWKVL